MTTKEYQVVRELLLFDRRISADTMEEVLKDCFERIIQ